MNKYILLWMSAFSTLTYGQQYAPAAGEPGSTAISYDDSRFVGWATNVELQRGYVDIGDTSIYYGNSNKATFGTENDAVGPATNLTTDVVSLGDSGIAIVTFAAPLKNGLGPDFAIFENGLSNTFLELAHVEVSSDGINYYRFPSHSETQTESPIGGFGMLEPTYLNNFAGKYKVGYGTPFDLEELKDSIGLNVDHITHIKILDVVGSLGSKGTKDSYGNKINDPYPTPFNSGGFDLNGVGVIHQQSLGLIENNISFKIYPNPSNGIINIEIGGSNYENQLKITNSLGKLIEQRRLTNTENSIQLALPKGVYFIQLVSEKGTFIKKTVIR